MDHLKLENGSLVNGIVSRLELDRCQVLEALMRPDVVVMPAPDFDHDASLLATAEPFERQAFVTEFAVEALVVAVLPGFARIDQCGVYLRVAEPFEDRVADELRAVVRAEEPRRAVLGDQTREYLDHAGGANRAGHVDRQALAGELVNDGQALDLLAARAGIEYEVVRPDVVRAERWQGSRP